ncbi:MAG: hypothetical protein M8352_10895, partial [ANME-2 cluster archaeon]|nr:hypothetical protein [ANME-2 cluster archaeon]
FIVVIPVFIHFFTSQHTSHLQAPHTDLSPIPKHLTDTFLELLKRRHITNPFIPIAKCNEHRSVIPCNRIL